jgi:hypothetical protein
MMSCACQRCQRFRDSRTPLQALPSFILRMSVGNFCATESYADGFDCGTRCTLSKVENSLLADPAPVDGALTCADVLPQRGKAGGEGALVNDDGCPVWGVSGSGPQGICCALAPPKTADHGALVGIIWLWCTAAMVVYLLWLLWLQRGHADAEATLVRHNVGAGDYTVWLSNVGNCDGNDADLETCALIRLPLGRGLHDPAACGEAQ